MIRSSASRQEIAIDVKEINAPVPRSVDGSCRLFLPAIKKGDLVAFLSQNRLLQLILVVGNVPFHCVGWRRQKGLVQCGRVFAHSGMPNRTDDPSRRLV